MASICTLPNEIDVPPSISVGTAREGAQRAGDTAHNSQSPRPHSAGKGEPGFT